MVQSILHPCFFQRGELCQTSGAMVLNFAMVLVLLAEEV